MALLIPGYPDPHDVAGRTIDGVYAWIAELAISYGDGTARFVVWFHQSAEAAATWPAGDRVPRLGELAIFCGSEVVGRPGVTFPTLAEIEADAAAIAAGWLAEIEADAGAAVRDAVARGAAIRSALYAALRELAFPDAAEVE